MIMLRLALALVRLWTALYTHGMPEALRQTRRAEIESDLWESQHDRRPESDRGMASQMILRLFRGIPDDCLWRLELMDLRSRRRRTGVWLAVTAGGLFLAFALWIGPAMTSATLPTPPNLMIFVAAPPPPPLPPPPPPPPTPSPERSDRVDVEAPPPPPPPPVR
jgi:hypothetical protein